MFLFCLSGLYVFVCHVFVVLDCEEEQAFLVIFAVLVHPATKASDTHKPPIIFPKCIRELLR